MAVDLRPVDWKDGKVVLIDQTRIPDELVYLEYADYRQVAEAIRAMQVRGAPAIGVTAALGIALAAQSISEDGFLEHIGNVADEFRATRPTAVNLFWAIERMLRTARENACLPASQLRRKLLEEALTILEEDIEVNKRIGINGAQLIRDGDTVLTHCNAGALATAGYGTALGVIRAAVESGKKINVIADETRPRLQGMRLTAWELQLLGIPVTVITDNTAGYVMRKGLVNCVIVGADRIAANGDVANKVGTYSVAILARTHGIPFYVAAPMSTIDLSLPNGEMIPIEERSPEEVTHISGIRIAPEGISVMNPAFDITPAEYVTAIITEFGIIKPPYEESLAVNRR
ncbi:MAG: S-methyl-5-thioribose-1-phosphate isomerase [Armatimonadota bacterium]|nr:S-methyl-5-thioribose-1-phosphate isomerase [Armatimonadota bacterium]